MADKKFQFRRDTEANWTAKNPVLLLGEVAYTIDANGKLVGKKFGDGTSNWNDLPYSDLVTTDKIVNKAVTEDKLADSIKNKLDILYKVTLTFTGGGNKKKGTSVNINLSWTVKVNGTAVNPARQTLNGEVLENSIRAKSFSGVTDDTIYTLNVDGVTATQLVKFYNPAYFGVVNPSYQVSNDVQGLTELTNYGTKAYTKTITTTGSKKAVYLYPSALGNLTRINDGNNFDVTDSFTKVTGLTINGESYVGYILTKEASLNNVTFKFS